VLSIVDDQAAETVDLGGLARQQQGGSVELRLLFNVKSSRRGCGNRGAAGSYLKQNYEMLAERARGLLSGDVSRPDEHETRRHTI
jgi:hypothetical protein